MNSPSLCCGEIVKACGSDGGIEALLEPLVFEAIAMNWHSLWIGNRLSREQHLERGMVADPPTAQYDWISHGPGTSRTTELMEGWMRRSCQVSPKTSHWQKNV